MFKFSKLAIALLLISSLVGCVTITGSPREENIVYQDVAMVSSDHVLSSSVEVGDISGFPGTSALVITGNTNPNLSNKAFRDNLIQSLDNAGLLGQGYVLHAKLTDSSDWSLWGHSYGHKSRDISVEYTLVDDNDNIIFSEVIEGDGSVVNKKLLRSFHLVEREAAEKGYRNNIANLIERLKEVY